MWQKFWRRMGLLSEASRLLFGLIGTASTSIVQNAIVLTFSILVDHVGNMKTFPGSVNLIVGPGFKKGLVPGYPTNKDSHVLESDWEGREMIELEFNGSLKLGQYNAIDYFEDGSFYLLDIPGHAIGHIGGLARVSKDSGGEEDSFVFMAGDTCHHGKPEKFQICFTKV
jgi:hypothetical protein